MKKYDAVHAMLLINSINNSQVVSALVKAMMSEHAEVRSTACSILGRLGSKVVNDEVIDALIIATTDEHFYVRFNSCSALGQLGSKLLLQQLKMKTMMFEPLLGRTLVNWEAKYNKRKNQL